MGLWASLVMLRGSGLRDLSSNLSSPTVTLTSENGESSFAELCLFLEGKSKELSKWRLEELIHVLNLEWKRRFKKRRTPKYGSVNRAFTQEELDQFLGAVKGDKFRLLFEYMAMLALRIGESIKINLKDFNFQKRELRLTSEKSQVADVFLVPIPLFEKTLTYIEKHKEKILEMGGFLFFKDNLHRKKECLHVDKDYVRRIFRECCVAAGIDEVYGFREGGKKGKLHRHVSHSLRHFSVTAFYDRTRDIELTRRFSRHRRLETLQIYLHKDEKELREAVDRVFSKKVDSMERLKSML